MSTRGQAQPEAAQQSKDPEPEPEPEQGGHQVVTEGDVDLPVPPQEAPQPLVDNVEPAEEELTEPVMPFTGDEG